MKKQFAAAVSVAAILSGLGFSSGAFAGLSQPESPSVKIGRAPLVTPTAASAYYSGRVVPTVTYTLPSGAGSGRPPEIQALARALKNDIDLIFEYVHDKVEYVPLFGLQKGALGTYVDGAGTAFDQAQLLVELLREAGYANAKYVIGDVTLSNSNNEFTDWFGVSDAKAVCHILADGGIPALVNGSSAAGCGVSGTVSSVKFTHAWVDVDGRKLDPSLKKRKTIAGTLDIATDMGYDGTLYSSAGGSGDAVNTRIKGFNTTSINTKLDTYASNLIAKVNDNSNYNKSLAELIGGYEIIPLQTRYDGSFGTNTQPAGTRSVSSTVNEIPVTYRTTVSLLGETFYADELYGRRLVLDWYDPTDLNSTQGVEQPSLAQLKLGGQLVTVVNTYQANANPNGIQEALRTMADAGNQTVLFEVDHAYAANGGEYMDRSYQRGAGGFSQSVSFVFGFAGSSTSLMNKLTSERLHDVEFISNSCSGTFPDPNEPNTPPTGSSKFRLSETQKTQLGYGWLSQFDMALGLQAEVVDAVVQHHHSFGMVSTTAEWSDACPTDPHNDAWVMNRSAMQLDILSGISVNHRDGSEVERRATGQAMAIAGATLEGSVFEQFAGKSATASTTERFEWFNRKIGNEYFHIVDDQDAADIGLSGHQWYQDYKNEGYLIIAPHELYLGPGTLWNTSGQEGADTHECWFASYRCAEEVSNPSPTFNMVPSRSYEAGAAFIAVKPDGSDVAHIVFTGKDTAKGGGAEEKEGDGDQFDPTKVADTLRDKFEDRSKLHGIDIANGQVSYSPAADVSTGAGSFPYALSFQRTYATGGSRSRGLGVGWTHNWDMSASFSGSGTEAMGATKAVRAVPSLVAFYAMQDILAGRTTNYAKDQETLKRMLVPTFVAHWWREHLQHNVVSIQQGSSGIQFVRLADGSFDAPIGSAAKLEQTAVRTLQYAQPCPTTITQYGAGVAEDACKQAFKTNQISLTLTNAGGDQIIFDKDSFDDATTYPVLDGIAETNPNIPQFFPSKWKFPAGVELTFTHDLAGRLTRVESNLGGATTNLTTGPWISLTWNGESLQSVSGKGVGLTSFTYGSGGDSDGQLLPSITNITPVVTERNSTVLASSTNALNEVTTYTYMGNGLNTGAYDANNSKHDWFARLYEVNTPEYTQSGAASYDGLPSMRYTYDPVWSVATYADGEAIRTPSRGTWDFFVAQGFRGERVAPTVQDETGASVRPAYQVYYDYYDRAARYVDEGGRTTTASFDGIGRVTERIFPGDSTPGDDSNGLIKSQFTYDRYNNVLSYTMVGRDNSTRTVTAEYNDADWPNAPTRVTDAVSNADQNLTHSTSISYYAKGATGAGQPHIATLPTVGGGTNQYTYTYNSFGQPLSVIDPEGLETLNTYDGSTSFPLTTVVDNGGENLTSTFAHNTAGDRTSVNGPRTDVADVTTTTYDALRRPTVVTDPTGINVTTVYDKDGRELRKEVRDGSAVALQVTGQSFTATGQVANAYSAECYTGTSLNTSNAECSITTTAYDAMDRPDLVTDGENRQTKTRFYVSGETHSIVKAYGTALEQNYQTYGYTETGQVAWVADANGNKTTYRYDVFDQLYRTFFPDPDWTRATPGQIGPSSDALAAANWDYEEYLYDANGNMRFKRTRADDWIENTYDHLNRVAQKTVRRDSQAGTIENSVSYTYDNMGRDILISQSGGITEDGVSIPSHKLFYCYDSAGRLDFEIQGASTVTANASAACGYDVTGGRKVDVGHDKAGNRDELIYPAGAGVAAKTLSFAYDAANRMDTVKQGASTLADYSYDAVGRKSGLAYLGGATSAYAYHRDSAIASISQTFVGSGEPSVNDVTYAFGYNLVNQVTNRHISNLSYVYDGFKDAGVTAYASNGLNQYETVGETPEGAETVTPTSYSYDANANLTDTGIWLYRYDVENRLVEAQEKSTAKTVRFQYDAKGRRIAKQVDTDSDVASFTPDIDYEYLYEGDEPIQDYLRIVTTFQPTQRYAHGASVDERLVHWAYDTAGVETTQRYYHRDHQGSIIAMSDASGEVVLGERYTYDAYGNQVEGQTQGQPFRYTGRRWDDETGLYYYRARYYSAELGRFLQTDPIGYEDNMNLYGYTANDPVNKTDPTGMCGEIVSIYAGCNTGGTTDNWIGNKDAGESASQRPRSYFQQAAVGAAAGGNGTGTQVGPQTVPGAKILNGIRRALLKGGRANAIISAIAAAMGEAPEEIDVYFHYTDKAGAKGIKRSLRIAANSRGHVYLTKNLMSANQAHQNLFLGIPYRQNHGEYLAIVSARRGVLKTRPDPSIPIGLIHDGPIRQSRNVMILVGKNLLASQ